MHIPSWKKYLSYLWEVPLESTSSDYNAELHVSLRWGRLQLSTANAIYSYADLYTNFAKTFARYRWAQHPVQEVLLLGLGLGSIPYLLERTHGRQCRYTAVEIDEVIIELAHDYVLNELDAPIETICGNALFAVAQLPAASYDLICVDIFEDDKVPAAFETTDFLEAARALLRPGGVLLFNRLAYSHQDRQHSETFYQTTFRQVFPRSALLPVARNYMLISEAKAVADD
jgi:spermidine synthase